MHAKPVQTKGLKRLFEFETTFKTSAKRRPSVGGLSHVLDPFRTCRYVSTAFFSNMARTQSQVKSRRHQSSPLHTKGMAQARVFFSFITSWAFSCGSKSWYQNGTLVSGNMDQNLRNVLFNFESHPFQGNCRHLPSGCFFSRRLGPRGAAGAAAAAPDGSLGREVL